MALDFPELTIVCGHSGYAWTTEMIAVADKHENVYIDTSAYAAHRYPGEFVAYLNGRGKTKVLFGTNYPMMTAERALARLDDLGLGLGDDTRALFLADNATRVFRLYRQSKDVPHRRVWDRYRRRRVHGASCRERGRAVRSGSQRRDSRPRRSAPIDGGNHHGA